MINYIIIAGPQSSGKTTALKYLQKKYGKQIIIHPEINQYVLFPNSELGSIIVDKKMEKIIHKADIQRIKSIKNERKLHIAETDIFHLVYYLIILGESFYHKGLEEYKNALKRFQVFNIFINTKPAISFKRRQNNYLNRIKKQIIKQNLKEQIKKKFQNKMLKKYQNRIEQAYPLWLRVYSEINFAKQKIMIDNNHSDINKFYKDLEKSIKQINEEASVLK